MKNVPSYEYICKYDWYVTLCCWRLRYNFSPFTRQCKRMLWQLFYMLRVVNILNKLANLVFALHYFDFTGFLEVIWNHLGEFYFQAQEIIILLANTVDNVIQLTFQGCEIFVTSINKVKKKIPSANFVHFLSRFSIINLMFLLEAQQPHGYVPVNSKTAHAPPPRATPRAFDFFEKFWSNSPLCCQFRRQMPHLLEL